VLRWDEDGTLGADYLVRGDGIRLFLSICLPITAITVAVWGFMYSVARRWARRHARELGLRSPGYAEEKGVLTASQQLPMPVGDEKMGTGTGLGII